MPDSEKSQSASDELERYVDGKLEVDQVQHAMQPGQDERKYSVGGRQYSTSGRRLSQWDAMIIAKEGGAEIDDEIQMLEEELAANPVKHSLLNPKIDVTPEHFTWCV